MEHCNTIGVMLSYRSHYKLGDIRRVETLAQNAEILSKLIICKWFIRRREVGTSTHFIIVTQIVPMVDTPNTPT